MSKKGKLIKCQKVRHSSFNDPDLDNCFQCQEEGTLDTSPILFYFNLPNSLSITVDGLEVEGPNE